MRNLAFGRTARGPGGETLSGPIADALTHVGQIAILRRMADAPVRAENYFSRGNCCRPGWARSGRAETRNSTN